MYNQRNQKIVVGILTGITDAVENDNDFNMEIFLDLMTEIVSSLKTRHEIEKLIGGGDCGFSP